MVGLFRYGALTPEARISGENKGSADVVNFCYLLLKKRCKLLLIQRIYLECSFFFLWKDKTLNNCMVLTYVNAIILSTPFLHLLRRMPLKAK